MRPCWGNSRPNESRQDFLSIEMPINHGNPTSGGGPLSHAAGQVESRKRGLDAGQGLHRSFPRNESSLLTPEPSGMAVRGVWGVGGFIFFFGGGRGYIWRGFIFGGGCVGRGGFNPLLNRWNGTDRVFLNDTRGGGRRSSSGGSKSCWLTCSPPPLIPVENHSSRGGR